MCKLTQHIKSIFLDTNSVISTNHNIFTVQGRENKAVEAVSRTARNCRVSLTV